MRPPMMLPAIMPRQKLLANNSPPRPQTPHLRPNQARGDQATIFADLENLDASFPNQELNKATPAVELPARQISDLARPAARAIHVAPAPPIRSNPVSPSPAGRRSLSESATTIASGPMTSSSVSGRFLLPSIKSLTKPPLTW
jgi:hypothetical protein